MTEIKKWHESDRSIQLKARIITAIKWWGEHQAWPATDEIRVDWRRRNCR